MPERTFTCGLDAAVALMGGKWKGLLLFALQDGPLRFGELRRTVGTISERMLILQLKEMQTAGLLHREVFQLALRSHTPTAAGPIGSPRS
jgi:DNA-binding HxlR family transcriptional regulator